jgi:hypothetical protein
VRHYFGKHDKHMNRALRQAIQRRGNEPLTCCCGCWDYKLLKTVMPTQ